MLWFWGWFKLSSLSSQIFVQNASHNPRPYFSMDLWSRFWSINWDQKRQHRYLWSSMPRSPSCRLSSFLSMAQLVLVCLALKDGRAHMSVMRRWFRSWNWSETHRWLKREPPESQSVLQDPSPNFQNCYGKWHDCFAGADWEQLLGVVRETKACPPVAARDIVYCIPCKPNWRPFQFV